MSATLAATALLMGLAGGPHCAAMCGAACAGVVRLSTAQPVGAVSVRWAGAALSHWQATALLQLGRLLGYAVAGALAASAMQSLAWLTTHAAALRPLWALLHGALLVWGLMLLVMARQPAWVDQAGRVLWSRIQPLAQARGGLVATGALWAFMPCGLLYSALLVAALSGGALEGAGAMALFAAGSSISVVAAPWLLLRLHDKANHWRQDWGTRLAGLALIGVAAWALWMDVAGRVGDYCR